MFTSHSPTHALVARIALLLDEADIPNVIWGDYLLYVYKVPTIVEDVSFVVPDHLISKANSTLLTAGFSDCSTYTTCRTANLTFRVTRAPFSHVHVNENLCIKLFKKTETLWRVDFSSLPLLGQVKTAENPSVPIGDGKVCFPPELDFVRVPTANCLLEAYILLMARDRHKIYEHFWSAMLTYIGEFVEGTGLIMHENLEPRCRDVYNAMFTGNGSVFNEMLDRLDEDGKLELPQMK